MEDQDKKHKVRSWFIDWMSSTCVHTTQTKCTELLTRVGVVVVLGTSPPRGAKRTVLGHRSKKKYQSNHKNEVHRRRNWVPRDNSILHHVHWSRRGLQNTVFACRPKFWCVVLAKRMDHLCLGGSGWVFHHHNVNAILVHFWTLQSTSWSSCQTIGRLRLALEGLPVCHHQ